MTNEEYMKKLDRIFTDAEAQKQVVPLWQDFVQCRISSTDYKIRLDYLEATIRRCRAEDRKRASQQMKLDRVREKARTC